jgi:alpha-tubulin suppressor-like RCC1 family protein
MPVWKAVVLGLALAPTVGGCAKDATGPRVDDAPGQVSWLTVDAGEGSCAVAEGGAAYSWGSSLLPACSGATCARPTPVPGASAAFTSVVTGDLFACGVTDQQEAYCWGRVFVGSLGDGATLSSATPVKVAIPEAVLAVTAGYEHACALSTAGAAYCWGGIGSKLGLANGVDRAAAPQPVATSLRFASISAGTTQTCALTADHEAYCWGGGYGSLGVGARDTSCAISDSCLDTPVPMRVDGSYLWASISAGNGFTCGVTLDHQGYCWGAVKNRDDMMPAYGVLGNGGLAGSKAPQPVRGGLLFQAIATGIRHACGLVLDGAAYCWGSDGGGELAIGYRAFAVTTPQPVIGGLRFAALGAGEHSCGVSVNRNIFCWGIATLGGLGTGILAVPPPDSPVRILSP